MRKRRFVRTHILVFLAPAVLIYTAFMIYPLFDSLWLSLNNKSATASQIFVGIQNYQTLFSDLDVLDAHPFWQSKQRCLFHHGLPLARKRLLDETISLCADR